MGSWSIEALNNIRANASSDYQDRIPEATRSNIASIGNAFETYTQEYNYYTDQLMYKIGLTTIETNVFESPLARFKTGGLSTGQDVEDIFVDQFRKSEGTYDPSGLAINPFARRDYNDVKVYYHRMNRKDKYVVTINQDDHIRAFRSPESLQSFYAAQLNSLYTGAEYDEFVLMKQILGDTAPSMFTYYIKGFTGADAATAKLNITSSIKTFKKAVLDMSFVSELYNPAAIKAQSKVPQQILFILKDIGPEIDVELYGQIFGPSYAGFDTQVVILDNFGSLNDGTVAILTDENFFKAYDVKVQMENLKNPDNMSTNYWLHIWQILSTAKYKNCVRFVIPGTNSITYNINGGTGSTAATTGISGTVVALSTGTGITPPATKTLAGWCKAATVTAAKPLIVKGSQYAIPDEDLVLYAIYN